MSGADGVEIRDFEPERDAAALADLFARVFGTPKGGQTLDWMFRPGPAGPSARTVAVAEGRIVGHAGATAMRFRAGGETVRGGYSVAAMTDPAMRGRRLFFRMGEHLYRRMEELGFAFVAGFSNENSFRLMTGPLQRTPIRPFPWCVRPLAPWSWRRASAPRADDAAVDAMLAAASHGPLRIARATPDDARFDAVWARAQDEVGVGAVRDAAFVAWRFGTRPDAGYRLLLAERDGDPVAWLALRSLALREIPACFVVDQVVAPDAVRAGRALLACAARIARREGAVALSSLLPARGAVRSALVASGFVRVPEALHPQTIRFSVRGLGAHAARRDLVDRSAWRLAWSDTDVV